MTLETQNSLERFLPTSTTVGKLSDITIKALLEFEKLGYTVRVSKNALQEFSKVDWNISDNKRGIRVKMRQSGYGQIYRCVYMVVSARNDIGNYKKINDIVIYNTSADCRMTKESMENHIPSNFGYIRTFEDVFRYFDIVKGKEPTNQWRKKSDLPNPFGFTNCMTLVDKTVTCQVFFKSIEVDSLVIVNKNLTITTEGIEKPNAEVWYHMRGKTIDRNGNDRIVSIIVNSDITGFFALSIRRFDFVITPNMSPNDKLYDFNNITEIDKKMIELAIEEYLRSVRLT